MNLALATNIIITSSDSDDSETSFAEFWKNDNNVKGNDKQRYILAAAHGAIDNFTLEAEPYSSASKKIFPTRDNCKKEILRRDPERKGISNKTVPQLLSILCEEKLKVTNSEDIIFITSKENDIKTL